MSGVLVAPKRETSSPEEAVTAAHLGCGRATFVASGAAALAYASLIITDFRGFRDFGLIGCVGMVLCWVSAIAFLPALTVVSERLRPIRPVASRRGGHTPYGDLFRKVALARPQWTLAFAFLMTCATGLATAHFFASDPFEYNFRKLTSVRAPGDRIAWVNARQSEVAPETQVGNALLVLAPDEKALPEVERQLQQVTATQGRVLGKVQSLQSLLPQEQKEKVRIVNALRADLAPLASRLDDQDRSRLDAFLPKQDLHELTTADLPDDVARTFRERDGSSGRILYVEHHASRNRWDGAYWIEWVKAVRSVRLSSGQVAVAGNPVVFADMLATIRQDAPRAMLVSFGATVVLIACCLRRLRNQLVTIVALLLGILWMIGGMAALGLKLHFLNLLAFPIALGNGVDYAVNVVQRFETESSLGKSAAQAAAVSISETGGAVVLCSLTTIFGYLSIHVSQNQALRSFAMAMAVAEWTCLLVAVVVVPAWLSLTRRPEPVQFIAHRQPVD